MSRPEPYSLMHVDFLLGHIRENAEKQQFFNAITWCAELTKVLLRGLRDVVNHHAPLEEKCGACDGQGGRFSTRHNWVKCAGLQRHRLAHTGGGNPMSTDHPHDICPACRDNFTRIAELEAELVKQGEPCISVDAGFKAQIASLEAERDAAREELKWETALKESARTKAIELQTERDAAINTLGKANEDRERLRDQLAIARHALADTPLPIAARLELEVGLLAETRGAAPPGTAAFFTTHQGPECPECKSIMIPHGVGLRCVNCGCMKTPPVPTEESR